MKNKRWWLGVVVLAIGATWSAIGKDAFGLEAQNRAPTLPHYGDGLNFIHRGLHRNNKDERTVTTACLKPVFQLGLQTAEGFLRTGTRRISSRPGEQISTQRPDTLTQTLSLRTFPLQSDGGPYISESLLELPESRAVSTGRCNTFSLCGESVV
jgi:hypothetical protein